MIVKRLLLRYGFVRSAIAYSARRKRSVSV
jgi:hypothetical protein